MKTLNRLVLAIFFAFSVAPLITAPVNDIAKNLMENIHNHKAKIGVLGFETTSAPAYEEFSGLLAEQLTTATVQTKKATIVERRLLKKLLNEKGLNMTGIMNVPVEAGKILNLDYVVTETLLEINENTAELNARLVDANTGEIVSALSLGLELNEKKDDINKITNQDDAEENAALIQIAILLDTSNSMDGLIAQGHSFTFMEAWFFPAFHKDLKSNAGL
ncbi:MAG: FlgO family outer membrane protein [Spirochaetia bacterium]|nr:FlgO family outer membrane protein [Spirochaetia bacterium]